MYRLNPADPTEHGASWPRTRTLILSLVDTAGTRTRAALTAKG